MKSRDEVIVRADQNHMATTFELLIACRKEDSGRANRALDDAHECIAILEQELSEFLESSPIHRLNRTSVSHEFEVPRSVIEILELSHRLRVDTKGLFDCTAKSKNRDQLGPESLVGWSAERRTAWRLHPDAHIGFGAIGKGFALDRVALILDQAGFEDYLLSGGGSSVVLSGFHAPEVPWTWAWSWAKNDNGEDLGVRFPHSSGKRIAIGVSGIHEKGRHIVNPTTGKSAHEMQSALIGRISAAEADGLSTAFFVSPSDTRQDPRFPGAWIDRKGTARWNEAFEKYWGPVSRNS